MSTRAVNSAIRAQKPDLFSRAVQAIRDGSLPSKIGWRFKSTLAPDKFALPEMEFVGEERFYPETILDDICLSPFYGPHDHDDVTPLFSLLRAMAPKHVIEFGTAQGNTTANICRLTDAQVISVNATLEVMSGHLTTFELNRDDIGRVYRRKGFEARVRQIYANTLYVDLVGTAAPSSAEIAIIDACHDYEYVLSDFVKLAPMIRQGGIILLHDTHPGLGPPRDGSYLACKELRRRGWDIRHVRNTWWGIWVCGGIRGSPVEALLTNSTILKALTKLWKISGVPTSATATRNNV